MRDATAVESVRARRRAVAVLAVLLWVAAGPATAPGHAAQGGAPAAATAATPPPAAPANAIDALLLAGDLLAAEQAVAPLRPEATTDATAALAAGRVHLFRNDLPRAQEWLRRALALGADAAAAKRLLAEALRRRGDHAGAATLLRAAGREADAAQQASLAGSASYALAPGGPDEVVVPFTQTDPLPLLGITVNGKPVTVLLDTGGADLILDPETAAALGAQTFGSIEGTFGGGRKAPTTLGRVDSIGLGAFTLGNVPVQLLSTARFGVVCGGCRVDGVLGTGTLAHFLATIDYPAGELRLRRRGAPAPAGGPAEPRAPAAHVIRLWMAGDHYLLALGSLGDVGPLPFVVDTGLAGMAFTAPPWVFDQAGLKPMGEASTGVGGGGPVTVMPVQIPRLSLGTAQRDDLLGVVGPFPAALETAHGVRIAGLVSHAFFRPWRVTLDFDRMELRLTEPAAPAAGAPGGPGG